jgi:hypothetical protein
MHVCRYINCGKKYKNRHRCILQLQVSGYLEVKMNNKEALTVFVICYLFKRAAHPSMLLNHLLCFRRKQRMVFKYLSCATVHKEKGLHSFTFGFGRRRKYPPRLHLQSQLEVQEHSILEKTAFGYP